MGWFWFWTGRSDVGWRAVSAALDGGAAADVSCALRARTWTWAGLFGIVMDVPTPWPMVERGIEDARACGHLPTLGAALGTRAALRLVHGHAARASGGHRGGGALLRRSAGPVRPGHDLAASRGGRHDRGSLRGRRAGLRPQHRALPGHRATSGPPVSSSSARQSWPSGKAASTRRPSPSRRRSTRAREIPNRFAHALVVTQLASVRLGQGRLDEAAALADEAVGRGQPTSMPRCRPRPATSGGGSPCAAAASTRPRPTSSRRCSATGPRATSAGRPPASSDLGRIATARGDHRRAVERHGRGRGPGGGERGQDGHAVRRRRTGPGSATAGAGERAGRLLGVADGLRDAGARPWDPNVDEREAALSATRSWSAQMPLPVCGARVGTPS